MSETTKQLSGAQKRKARKARDEEARREEDTRRSNSHAMPRPAAYAGIETPPLEDPTVGLVWARKCMLAALSEVINDPIIDAEKRWRFISDLGGKIGMTYAKALMEAKVDKVTKALGAKDDVSGGTESIKGIARPKGARRRARSGSGDEVSGSEPDPKKSEE